MDLGGLELRDVDGRALAFGSKARMLLAVLLNADGRPVSVPTLADLLWSEAAQRAGASRSVARQTGNLHSLVWRLRAQLSAADLASDGAAPAVALQLVPEGYRIITAPGVVASETFVQLTRRASRCLDSGDVSSAAALTEEALGLWHGCYLGDLGDQSWALPRRDELDEARSGLLETRWAALLGIGRAQSVVEETQALLQQEVLRERPWELRMDAQLALRRPADALSSYLALRRLLQDELGLEPGPVARALQARALNFSSDGGPDTDGGSIIARRNADRPPKPPPPTFPLLGRETDVTALAGVLDRDAVRLVTLLGAGGVGKTSVALELTDDPRVSALFPDGVAWVDCAALRDPELLANEIAVGLGLPRERSSHPLDLLVASLGHRRLLVVLDNCEQIDGAGPIVLSLLSRCPQLTVLVTSRVPLGVRAEYCYQLPPLALPPADVPNEPDAVGKSTAVMMFVDRAQAVRADFTLTPANVAAIRQICERTDGIPLALELAAARLALFEPEALLTRLRVGLAVLGGGPRDRPHRQRTVEATLAWSYSLLSPSEQTLLRRLAVFNGGCSTTAPEDNRVLVDAPSGPPEEPSGHTVTAEELPDLLISLTAKSLLTPPTAGEPRLRLLETVRLYALSQLTPDEERDLRDRHLQHYLSEAEAVAAQLPGAGRSAPLDRLQVEMDNLRAAADWAAAHADLPLRRRLANSLGWFWYFRGPLNEGRTWLRATLGSAGAGDERGIATAYWHSGRLAHLQGDEADAAALLSESVRLWRRLRDESACLAYALSDLGQVRFYQGKLDEARILAEESVGLFRGSGDDWGLALALQDLGQALISAARLDAAHRVYEENLLIYSSLGDRWGRGLSLLGLGRVAMLQGDYELGRSLLGQSGEIFRKIADPRMEAYVLLRVGQLERKSGDLEASRHAYGDALATWRGLSNSFGTAMALIGLAGLAELGGHPEDTARLQGTAEALLQAIGSTVPRADDADHQPYLRRAQGALGPARFHSLHEIGRRTPIEEVLALQEHVSTT